MAGLTFVARVQTDVVLATLTARGYTMARRTTIDDGAVIDRRRNPRDLAVAHTAIGRGDNVVRRLPARQHAVVTLTAHGDRGLAVIEAKRRCPARRGFVMARVAGIGCRQSLVMLAALCAYARKRTVVASYTVADERRVIHRRGPPAGLGVTRTALLNCRNVRNRILARGQRTVVAGIASRDRGLCVIEADDRRPALRRLVMAGIAGVGR